MFLLLFLPRFFEKLQRSHFVINFPNILSLSEDGIYIWQTKYIAKMTTTQSFCCWLEYLPLFQNKIKIGRVCVCVCVCVKMKERTKKERQTKRKKKKKERHKERKKKKEKKEQTY